MISTELMGGIGNMMFQIAAIEAMGQQIGVPVYFADALKTIDRLSTAAPWTTHSHEYLSIFKNFRWDKNLDIAEPPERVVRVPFAYRHFIPENNTRYIGYFQSERYFENQRQYLLNLFTPSDMVVERLSKYDYLFDIPTCSVHVRRGNYLSLSHIHTVLDMNYYRRALSHKAVQMIGRFIVFSDDIQWCKSNFVGKKLVFIEDIDYICMFLMSRCDHHIIANSSFSWFGAWLGSNPDKRTIGPQQWFNNDNKKAKDIIPWHWETV